MRTRFHNSALFALAAMALAASSALAGDTSLSGRVLDQSGLALPGVAVTLTTPDGKPQTTVSDGSGSYAFAVPPGRYSIKAELSGFDAAQQDVVVVAGRQLTLDLTLRLAARQETVTVKGDAPMNVVSEAHPDAPVTVTREVVENGMLFNSQYDDVLPLLPNVVRAPDGSISVGGSRAPQGALFVNGFNFTDPVSGEPGIILPLEAVDSMDVFSGGYAADLGRASAGVTSVHTRPGADNLHSSFTSFLPRLRFTDGHMAGVQYWEPNAGISGPIVKGRLHYEQALSYRFDRNQVGTLAGDQDQKFDELASWTQFDAQLSPTQHLLTSFSFNPQHTDHANMTAFTPAASTPVLDRLGYNIGVGDRVTVGERSTVEVRLNLMRTSLTVAPNGIDPYIVGHQLSSGTYFDSQDMQGVRAEGGAEWTVTVPQGHLLRFGGSFGRAALAGADNAAPVTLERSDGSISRIISFYGGQRLATSTIESTAFLQDTWTVSDAVTLDAGLRVDGTSGIGQTVSPRFAWTARLPGGKSSISGSAGVFGDKLALEAREFPSLQSRSISYYDPFGALLGVQNYQNAIVGDLKVPVAARWDLQFDQQISRGWLARVRYQERHGWNEPIVRPIVFNETLSLLALQSTGISRSRSLETTLAYRTPTAAGQFYISYVRSQAIGDLNSFDAIEGVIREPYVQANQLGPLPADVPHRVLAWAIIHLPWRMTVAPYAEVRSGFPFSAIDENWQYVGARNSYRYPWFGSLDLYVHRVFDLPFHLPQARIGVKFYSIVSAHSERDVQRDIMRQDFGTLYNPIPRDFAGVFELLWGHK